MKDAEAQADEIMKALNLANPDDEKAEGADKQENQGIFFGDIQGIEFNSLNTP